MKLSQRLKNIAYLIDEGSIILDVGTDHAYLPIYLIKNKLVHKAYASDISKKVLETAEYNIKKYNLSNKIILFESDGLKNIDVFFDTLIITGMGYNTIKNILSNSKLPDKIIIQTNSEHYNLRKYMNELGFVIKKELSFIDKNIYYVIIKFIRGQEKLTKPELLFGKSNNYEYYLYLKNYYQKIKKSVPLKRKIRFMYYIIILNKLLKKNRA